MTHNDIHADRVTRTILAVIDQDKVAFDAAMIDACADDTGDEDGLDGLRALIGTLATSAASVIVNNAGSPEAAAASLRQSILDRAATHDDQP